MFRHNTPNAIPSCGIYIIIDNDIKFLPIVSLDVHTSIVASTSRTVLTQTFVTTGTSLKNVKYVFPLYDGVSVVGFECTIGSRVIKGVVKEREEAKQEYQAAVASGKIAGLLEQSLEASDVFSTSLGNIPSRAKSVKVEITYLGELKHDAQVDGLRFTIPTRLAPRYGQHSMTGSNTFQGGKHITITVDADVSSGSAIKSIQSPSHPISVNIGTLSTATSDPPSLQKAHATLSQGSAELDRDFIIQIAATGLGDPMAVLETHPTIPNQRALMATLVPRFNLPMEMTEVVFLCDRSGSMGGGQKIPNIVDALKIFLKSLPVGVKFNICSFGSRYEFLWDRSMTYEEGTLETAIGYVSGFSANFGGTEMYSPMEDVFKRRYKDLNLEVILLTDGEIWNQQDLFRLINTEVSESKGAVRVFTLGVGVDVSHALIEGVARAGNGFAQTVGENEKMDRMLIRMLKGALTPHVTDYSLEIKYDNNDGSAEETDDEFEVIERVMDAMTLEVPSPGQAEESRTQEAQQPISLFDQSVPDTDLEMSSTSNSVKAKLPPLTVPRYLQAPFQIPPLFPFNRTSVYVLLSDSTPNRQPKSVILKGTSAHGPLSLEIPIATLTERGTTIHQLAARKATRELEDGRGWIFHVKNQDGKLLQEQFDGQFSDMVKREAVRLGTQYQVSGKWCSFVAIQDTDRNAHHTGEEGEENNDDGDEEDGGDEETDEFEELSFDEIAAPGAAAPKKKARRGAGKGLGKAAVAASPRRGFAAMVGRKSAPSTDSGVKRQKVASLQAAQQPIQQTPEHMAQLQLLQMAQQQRMIQAGMQQRGTPQQTLMQGAPQMAGGIPASILQQQQQAQAQALAQQQQQQQQMQGQAGRPQQSTTRSGHPFGLFAANSPMGGSFAATSTAGGLFGSANNTTPITGSSLFGSSAPVSSSGGLFGSANSSAPVSSSGGLFGSANSSAPVSSSGGLFGSSATASSAGGMFGGSTTPSTSGGLFGSASNSRPATGGSLFGGYASTSSSGGLFGRPTNTSSSGGLFGSSTNPSSSAASFGSANSSVPATGNLFGGGMFAGASPHALSFGNPSNNTSGGSFGSVNNDTAFGTQQPTGGGGLFGSSSAGKGLFGFNSSENDVLSTLSALQTFVGNWQWSTSLEDILGIAPLTATVKIQLPGQYTQHMDVLATLCAVVFLKKKLASEKDSWELLVQKAEDWLRAQTGEDVLELEKQVEEKLFPN
ncbi:VIT domain-containing protein [Trichoderma sp. SZMC 28013]